VGLQAEDPIPDDTSLVVFRKRLGEENFEEIFDEFIIQCKDKGLLKGKLKLIDATHIIADVAIPNTANLLKDGRRKILKAIEKEKNGLDKSLKRYLPEEKPYRRIAQEDLVKEVSLSEDHKRGQGKILSLCREENLPFGKGNPSSGKKRNRQLR